MGPLNSQLNAIKWGEFKLGDLFEIEKTLSFNKDALTQGQDYDYITRTSQNQGVLQTTGFVNAENLNPPFTWSLGLLQMDFFYRKKSWYAGQFMRKITPKAEIKNKINSRTAHYFTTLLNALKRPLLSVLVRDIDKTFREQKIQLPLKPTANAQTLEDIDFIFMEKFIAELEQCRLAELEAYLKATGLENTTLSNDEENALNVFNANHSGGNTPCGLTWQHFKLGDLFEMERGTRLTKANRIKGTRPLVTAGYENYGVAEYISNHEQRVFKGNTITIDMFANAFYRYSEYSADDNILVLTPKFTMSHRIGLCVTARINAVLKAKFSYGKQYRQKDFNVTIISLPLKPTANTQTLEDIDFDFMRTLINALMKQTIQGVVEYCGAKIQATKEVINQETPVQKDSLF
ncbi:restriction endonuclease subunit S [Helicobacter pylori]|uniref:restriction endonuclease subunit S n=1 Tax=Helicobacter pylori TaxID=210 RepID=UPI0009B32813|nr:restriction endonuclease subunit S [Helicobacter pylori]